MSPFPSIPAPLQAFVAPALPEIPSPLLQFRGGPQKYEVTGWLQIQGVRVTDEGTYRCFARNRVGEVVALASLTVFTPGKHHVLLLLSALMGTREGMFGQGALVWRELLEYRAVLGMPQQAAVHGLALVLVGKGTGTGGGNVTLSSHCHFRSAQHDGLFPAEAPHNA